MRKIDKFDDRKPDGVTPSTRLLLERHRRDIAEVSGTTPDLRDRVRFKTTGEAKQAVPHGLSYIPQIHGRPMVRHENATGSAIDEYREPDARKLYLVLANVPKGATVTLWCVPSDEAR
jgi:hypothetical protein